jgi:hypothetical protein
MTRKARTERSVAEMVAALYDESLTRSRRIIGKSGSTCFVRIIQPSNPSSQIQGASVSIRASGLGDDLSECTNQLSFDSRGPYCSVVRIQLFSAWRMYWGGLGFAAKRCLRAPAQSRGSDGDARGGSDGQTSDNAACQRQLHIALGKTLARKARNPQTRSWTSAALGRT